MEHPKKSLDESGQNKQAQRRLVNRLIDKSDYEDDPEIQLLELGVDEILFEQGAEGDSMYVLKTGLLGVRIQHDGGSESEIARLTPGAVVGEMALISGRKRSATVYALNDARLVQVTKSRFQQMMEDDNAVLAAVSDEAVPRWQGQQLVKVLQGLLGDLDVAALEALQEQLEWRYYSSGEVVFRQGEVADSMYIVVNGRLRATITAEDGTRQEIGEISTGETVGEMAILTDEVRSATVHAVRGTYLTRIIATEFSRLTREYPELMGRVARIIVERQQRVMQGAKHPATASLAITLLPAANTRDVFQFAQELSSALAQFGTSLVLNSDLFDEHYGEKGAAQTPTDDVRNLTIVACMSELDARNKFILFVADPQPSAWTRRCIGQADRVLIVADPAQDPKPSPAEKLLDQLDVPVRSELVLWHPPQTEAPQGTMAWLETRQLDAHHHMRRGYAEHMARLARRLTGRAVGLVLSAGAARGYVHFGVYLAVLELDIPIDYVGGTSMGSIIGGLIARELTPIEMEDLAKYTAGYGVNDYTLPLASLMASENVTHLSQYCFRDLKIEDLWLPYFCVSSNLTTAEPVIHQRGLMWRAIRASTSIPGVYLPVIEGGDILADGGAADYFPVETMIDLCKSNLVIGVNVSVYKELQKKYDYDTSLSGWRILFQRINLFAKSPRVPSIIETLTRTMETFSARRIKRQESLVSLLIKPDTSGFGITDYEKYLAIARVGYDAALEPLREWKKDRLID